MISALYRAVKRADVAEPDPNHCEAGRAAVGQKKEEECRYSVLTAVEALPFDMQDAWDQPVREDHVCGISVLSLLRASFACIVNFHRIQAIHTS